VSRRDDDYWVGFLRQQVRDAQHIMEQTRSEIERGNLDNALAFLAHGLKDIERAKQTMLRRDLDRDQDQAA